MESRETCDTGRGAEDFMEGGPITVPSDPVEPWKFQKLKKKFCMIDMQPLVVTSLVQAQSSKHESPELHLKADFI